MQWQAKKFACFSNWPVFPPYFPDAVQNQREENLSLKSCQIVTPLMSNFSGPDLVHLLTHFEAIKFNPHGAGGLQCHIITSFIQVEFTEKYQRKS